MEKNIGGNLFLFFSSHQQMKKTLKHFMTLLLIKFYNCELILDLHCNHSTITSYTATTVLVFVRWRSFSRKKMLDFLKIVLFSVAGRQGKLCWLLANEKFPLQRCEIMVSCQLLCQVLLPNRRVQELDLMGSPGLQGVTGSFL